MKLSRLLLAFLAILAAGSAHAMQLSAVSGGERTADRDAIRSHIDKIFQAYIQKDADVIRATHAKDWTGFNQGSRSTIQGIDQYMQDANWYIKWTGKMTAYKMVEFNVIFYGDVAVVPYIADVSYDNEGQTSVRKLRVLDVYAKLPGGWNQVASDTTVHPETEAAELQRAQAPDPDDKKELFAAREAVWRSWFANDARLLDLVPSELIAIEQEEKFKNREDVLAGSKDFAANGGKLVRLEFPETEIQMYGYTAILYTKYVCEIEMNGKQSTLSGRATEMFVNRGGKWVNVGWHLDSGN